MWLVRVFPKNICILLYIAHLKVTYFLKIYRPFGLSYNWACIKSKQTGRNWEEFYSTYLYIGLLNLGAHNLDVGSTCTTPSNPSVEFKIQQKYLRNLMMWIRNLLIQVQKLLLWRNTHLLSYKSPLRICSIHPIYSW